THPLAEASTVSLKSLLAYPAILPAQSTITRKILEQAISGYRAHLNVSLETNYLETIKMMVSVGLGWSLLPVSMIHNGIIPLETPEVQLSR
ncbi:MAG TPA: LysR family transcriptional regulator, partial [Gammaproteobacteria bacterium]|nr:LysR family transcriptional regulator [Gammaproteobacteria bacterium]